MLKNFIGWMAAYSIGAGIGNLQGASQAVGITMLVIGSVLLIVELVMHSKEAPHGTAE